MVQSQNYGHLWMEIIRRQERNTPKSQLQMLQMECTKWQEYGGLLVRKVKCRSVKALLRAYLSGVLAEAKAFTSGTQQQPLPIQCPLWDKVLAIPLQQDGGTRTYAHRISRAVRTEMPQDAQMQFVCIRPSVTSNCRTFQKLVNRVHLAIELPTLLLHWVDPHPLHTTPKIHSLFMGFC